METSVFADKTKKPTERLVIESLGRAASLWIGLREAIALQHAPLTEEWVFGGKKYGWSLRLKQGSRAVLYMTPCPGYVRAGLALGERAVRAAHEGRLPVSLLKIIDDAPKYAEGRGIRLEVRRASDIRNIAKLAAIKMAH